jgi:jumonji domain-containing protein 2
VELNPPLYGADLPMSLFDDALATGCALPVCLCVLTMLRRYAADWAPPPCSPRSWNLRRLGCLLHTAGLPAIPGVTTPMVYVGCWRSNFAWHTEDADLYSVNFLHAGAPKSWYCVPPSARARFEAMAAGYFPELARACPAFLRHKDIMLSPSVLRQHGIPFTCALQRAGEFVINTAGAYHSGFNHGFNLAEATNFATPAWPPLGRAARRCVCCPDAVTIDMRLFAGGAEAHAARAQAQAQARAAEAPAAAPQPAVGDVVAVVGQDAARRRYLYLAQVLGAGAPGCVRLDWLQRSSEDGLYRVAPGPGQAWEEEAASLISALCYERVPGAAGQPDAVRLRTSTASLLRARLVPDEPPAKRPRET